MASIFELEQPTFGRSTSGKIVVAGGDEATSLTAAQCIESIITVTPTAGRAYTTATAAAIITALGDTVKVGQTFEVTVVNLASATHAVTFTANADAKLLLVGSGVVAAASSATFIGRVTAADAVTFFRA
jgi:hypothetical protein